MKLLFDQNLPWRLVNTVSHKFQGSGHVVSLGLSKASDQELWAYALENDFCICTKDDDFHQLSFLHGPPPKVVWLQIGNRPTWEITELLEQHLDKIQEFASTEEALMIIRQVPSELSAGWKKFEGTILPDEVTTLPPAFRKALREPFGDVVEE